MNRHKIRMEVTSDMRCDPVFRPQFVEEYEKRVLSGEGKFKVIDDMLEAAVDRRIALEEHREDYWKDW